MAIIAPTYELLFFFNHKLIGDFRKYASSLTYSAASSRFGVDSISFDCDMNSLSSALEILAQGIVDFEAGTALKTIIKPIQLECVVVRNGEWLVGGALIQMPSLNFNGDSAIMHFEFDGFANLLDGVILPPANTVTKSANAFVYDWVSTANTESQYFRQEPNGYPGFNIYYDSTHSITLPTIQRTYDNYKTVKELIFEMCDNTEGAGEFDMIFEPHRTYESYGTGTTISMQPYYTIQNDTTITDAGTFDFPANTKGDGIVDISVKQSSDFASHVILLGNGDTSHDTTANTVLVSESPTQWETLTGVEYPSYRQRMWQYSSISRQQTLDGRAEALRKQSSQIQWQPTVTFVGSNVPPSRTADNGIWIHKRITVRVLNDPLQVFARPAVIRKIEVEVSETNSELVMPTLGVEEQ